MSARIIVTGLGELKADLKDAPEQMRTNARKAVEVTARRMKDDMRRRAKQIAGPHAPAYPRAITYDLESLDESVRSEIGPDKDLPQGPLSNLLEGGSPTSAPHPHVTPAFEANKGDLDTGLERAIEDSLW